jgi:hypothetical protein
MLSPDSSGARHLRISKKYRVAVGLSPIRKLLVDKHQDACVFTVLFSTTPVSASRNCSVNIPSVNAFLTPFWMSVSLDWLGFASNLIEIGDRVWPSDNIH